MMLESSIDSGSCNSYLETSVLLFSEDKSYFKALFKTRYFAKHFGGA